MKRDKALKYLGLAGAVSIFSKDESTKVGCIIVAPDGSVRAMGYNGAVRGSRADEDERRERPEKYWHFEHGERNAIYNAARCGTPLEGCTAFITHPPCMDCARALVQAGIVSVVWNIPNTEFEQRWLEHKVRVERLFTECNVEWRTE